MYIAVSLKQSSKGTCQENFSTVRGCFGLSTAHVMALGALKREENEDDETRFHCFQIRHFSNSLEQL